MRMRSILGALVIASLPVMPAMAADMTPEEIKKLVDEAVEKRLQEYEHREGAREHKEGQAGETAQPGIGTLPEVAKERRADKQAPLSFGSSGSGRLVYAKPFVSFPKAIVGGYMDLQYRTHRNAVLETGYPDRGTTNGYDQQRFVPFIYADITEHLKFASELEIEHGVRGNTGQNEISLEFAHVDYLVNELLNVRAGIVLIPLGKFNLLHDSPLNDLTDRPIVSRLVIPSTMSETGAGLYGTFYPGRTGKVDYEVYYTTGPCGYNSSGSPRVTEDGGTKNSRQRKCASDDGFDINNGKAVSGRLAYSPMLGVEVGGSGYFGNQSATSYNPLSIYAVDWTLQKGPFELIGEAAWAYARGNRLAIPGSGFPTGSFLTGGSPLNPIAPHPQRLWGFYAQANYHFMPSFLTKLSPKRFGEGSTFTAVFRYDRVNLNMDNKGENAGEWEQLSFGLNYRPIEDAVIKMSYQYMPKAFNPVTSQRIHDSAFVMSVATYF
ncbi:MAG: TonB-dependent receptor [Nitrospira sp.]|nr:TonB-dependent receptor [Nitrospira sp.]